MIDKILNYKTELTKPVDHQMFPVQLVCGEASGHTINCTVTSGGQKITDAASCSVKFLRADGNTVAIQGSFADGVASVTLPQACYVVDGVCKLTMSLVLNSQVSVVLVLLGTVKKYDSSDIVDPSNTIPSIDELLAQIQTLEEVTESAVNNWLNEHPEVTESAVNNWLNEHPEATTTVQDGSITTEKLAPNLAAETETSVKRTQNSDGVISIMGDTAMSYIKFTDKFFYDRTGQYNNWSTKPKELVDGKHGITCSPFAMNLIYGVTYENSAYEQEKNIYDNRMFNDTALIDAFKLPDIGAWKVAKWSYDNGYTYHARHDFSDIRPGDILFTELDDSQDKWMKIGHCEIFAYWINDRKYAVWHGGSVTKPMVSIRDTTTVNNLVMCARLPMQSVESNLVNLVRKSEGQTHYTTNSGLVHTYHTTKKLKANRYYTAIFKLVSEHTIDESYPKIMRVESGDSLNLTYSLANAKPRNDVYVMPFVPDEDTNTINLDMARSSSSFVFKQTDVYWMDIFEGVITSISESFPIYYDDEIVKTEVTPTTCVASTHDNLGGVYYYTKNYNVRIHIAVEELTVNTRTTVFTLPTSIRPSHTIYAIGSTGSGSGTCVVQVNPSGSVQVISPAKIARVDVNFDIDIV